MFVMPEGGFAYLPEPSMPFSNGVAALDGYVLKRVRLRRPLPTVEGFILAANLIREHHRPLAALAGCELRIPSRLTRAGFSAYNAAYLAELRAHGFTAGDLIPMARSNMAPHVNPPASSVLAAFTFTIPRTAESKNRADFLISGKPEHARNPNRVIAPGDVSPTGMRQKAQFVLGELRRRVADLECQWADITGAQIYTVQPLDPVMEILAASGLAGVGLSLIPGEPPVEGYGGVPYEFEADVRSITLEENL